MTRKRILVVDDEIGFTRILKLTLEQATDYEVHVVNDSADAMRALVHVEPDIVLLDVMMPDIDGGDIAAQVRQTPGFAQIPIVFLTAAATPGEIAESCGVIGGFQFLAKPVDLSELLRCLRNHLEAAAL